MKTSYEPFTTQYTDEIINNIREYLKNHHFDTIAIDTLDMCHLIGKIDNLQTRIDNAIEYIHNHQLVFELSSKKQIQYWFDMFYKDLLDILRGDE